MKLNYKKVYDNESQNLQERTQDCVEMFTLTADEASDIIEEKSLFMLSHDEQARYSKMTSKEAATSFAAGRILLRTQLSKETGQDPAQLNILTDANERPFLEGSSIDFNLTHSHGLIVLAFSHSIRVGVDCESRLRSAVISRKLASRYFSEEENIYLSQLCDESLQNSFLQLWTLKECVLKMSGQGIARGGLSKTTFCLWPKFKFSSQTVQGAFKFYCARLAGGGYLSLASMNNSETLAKTTLKLSPSLQSKISEVDLNEFELETGPQED